MKVEGARVIKLNEAEWRNYFTPNPGLESYLSKVQIGNKDIYTTPWYKGVEMSTILDRWQPILESKISMYPGMLQFENDLRQKVGPMSTQKPLEDRLPDISSYYTSIRMDAEPILTAACDKVVWEFKGMNGLQLRSQKTVVENMKKSTNSGNPFFTKRRLVVDQTIPVLLSQRGEVYIQRLHGVEWYVTAIIGWRGQEGGPQAEDVKQRVVWMFPMGVNIAEAQLYQLAIEKAQELHIVAPWINNDEVDRRITQLFDTKGSDDLVICTDFSKFDQHFNSVMQESAKYIESHMLNSSESSRYWLDTVFSVKYNIPLVIGDCLIVVGPHGMASGSNGTNFDESLSHRALQHECALKSDAELNPNSMCLGDDGILSFPGITVDKVVSCYESHGQECNPDKQYASKDDCVFLRRYHSSSYRKNGICVGVYSSYRLLGRFRYLERFMNPKIWGREAVCMREIELLNLEEHHPAREELAQFCAKGDKYALGLKIPGFLDNIEGKFKYFNENAPEFVGYTAQQDMAMGTKPISEWWIVKYLRSLQ